MIFSGLTTVLLVSLMLYALLQARQFPVVARTLPFVCLAGVYIVWNPNETVPVARMLGIGRGADLILYIWVLVSGLLILGLHLKMVTQSRKLTEVVRALALANARDPNADRPEQARRG